MLSIFRLARITCLVSCLLSQASSTSTDDCFKGTAEEVMAACEDCCTAPTSCFWRANTTVKVCPHSCQGDYACDFEATDVTHIVVRSGSCIGDYSCQGFGWGSDADEFDADNSLEVWDKSCHGVQACQDAHATIGRDSCYGYRACANTGVKIDDETCLRSWSCLPGVEHIDALATYVGRLVTLFLVVVLILFLHPKAPRNQEVQQEQVLLFENESYQDRQQEQVGLTKTESSHSD